MSKITGTMFGNIRRLTATSRVLYNKTPLLKNFYSTGKFKPAYNPYEDDFFSEEDIKNYTEKDLIWLKHQNDQEQRYFEAYKRMGWDKDPTKKPLDDAGNLKPECMKELEEHREEQMNMIYDNDGSFTGFKDKRIYEFENFLKDKKLTRYLVDTKTVTNQTRLGKTKKCVAIVVVGNGEGLAGYGFANMKTPKSSILLATKRAVARLQPIPRYNDHTIWHELNYKIAGTQIKMRPRQGGAGIIAHTHIAQMCQLAGIKDISVTHRGNPNPLNLTRCFFRSILQQRTLEDTSLIRGVNLVPLTQRVQVHG